MYDHFQRMLRVVGLLAICLPQGDSRAADRPKKPMRETATVSADSSVLKRFGTIEDYLAEKRWTEAIDILQEIAQTDGRALVRTRPEAVGESAVYLNVTTRCNVLLSRLPPEGLAAYRKKVDPQAKRWLNQWKQTHDEADLKKVVREAFLSSVGDEALWELGESAWDRGEFGLARLYWTQLVPLEAGPRSANLQTMLRYPDSDLNPAHVYSRLILCTVMDGERERAGKELERFRELFPDLEGTLAGRQGRLHELLRQIIGDAIRWKSPTDSDDVTTFGLNAGRGGALSATIEIGASKWSHPLPSNRLSPERANMNLDRGPLSYHPVTFGDIVLVNNARSIWAWNLLSGEPAWPSERATGEIYPAAPEEVAGSPNLPCSGVPYHTMTIADGRLYARMGSAITNPASDATNAANETDDESLDNELICLDLAEGQGKLVWKIEAQKLVKDWRFEGSPLVLAGRVYLALSRRRPQFEFAIACLDAATGTLLWNRPVIASRGNIDDHLNRVSHLLLTAGAGRLFLSTDAGAIAAVSAGDGRYEWAITYESLASTRPTPPPNPGLLPALFHDGLLFVAPNDSNHLFCIETTSGHVRWQIPQTERWRHLLGVAPGGEEGQLIGSGNTLGSIDIATGKPGYGRQKIPHTSPADQGFGRGVLAGNVILWPTREAIKVVEATTGRTLENKPLNTAGVAGLGGNLTIARGMLLVSQPTRIVAYCEYSLLKQRLERELSERTMPDVQTDVLLTPPVGPGSQFKQISTLNLFGQLADVELALGNLDGAIGTLQKAIEAAGHGPADRPALTAVRNRLLELLQRAARLATEQGDPAVAAERLTTARQIATEAPDVVEILMELGQTEVLRNRPLAAVEFWQQILENDQLSLAKYHDSTAGVAAAKRITQLAKDQGPAVYAEVERRAKGEIGLLLESGDREGLRRTLRRYPNAQATSRAWRRLATLDRRTGSYDSALAILGRSLNRSGLPEERSVDLVDWADTLQAAGYFRTAHAAWKQLSAANLSDVDVDFEGTRHRVGELARRRLQNPAFKSYEPSGAPTVRWLDRIWTADLATGKNRDNQTVVDGSPATVIVPHGESPATNLACLLVSRQDTSNGSEIRCDCLDRATGQLRWSRMLPAVPDWATYSEIHLLLAAGNKLTAVSLETGRDLWSLLLTTSPETRLVYADGDRWRLPDLSDRTAKLVPSIQLCLRDNWVMAFDPRDRVAAIDSRTGEIAWTFAPPRGVLQPQWTCGARKVAVQTAKPSSTWLIDIGPACHTSEQPGTSEPWLQGPIVDDEMMLMINAQRRIECRTIDLGWSQWFYQGGISFSHVDPVLWSANRHMLVTVDGMTLSAINRSTGLADWSVGIANLPLAHPARQVVSGGDAAFAASHGLLRRISLKYGDCQWERFLGSAADQWEVALCGELIAAWPAEISAAAESKTIPINFVVWCDARTGRILQRLNFGKGERVLGVSSDEHGCLVRTDRAVIAFRAAPESREVVAAGPSATVPDSFPLRP